jgi:hypothetical protein
MSDTRRIEPPDCANDDFDREAVILRDQPAVTVSLGDHGHIVLMQEDAYGDRPDQIIIAPENLIRLAQVMIAVAGIDATITEPPLPEPERDTDRDSSSPPKDRTAAERQRRRRAKERDTAAESRLRDRDSTVTQRDSTVTEPDLLRALRPEKAGADNG